MKWPSNTQEVNADRKLLIILSMSHFAMELHDSRIETVHLHDNCLTIRLTVILHESDGRPGLDDGIVWLQRAELLINKIATQNIGGISSGIISEGEVRVGSSIHSNLVPLPLTTSEQLVLAVSFTTGEQFHVWGFGGEVRLGSERQFLEQFH